MAIEYALYRKRIHFGRPYHFVNEGPYLVENIYPDRVLQQNYVPRALISKGTQESPTLALHDANTLGAEFVDRGMNHDQGGWPKELNIMDEEAVLRYKKKLEREESFIESMKLLTKSVEHAVLQNNAINIYEKYYEDVMKEYSVSESISAITSIFRDKCDPPRPCSHLSWSPDGCAFAASYCNTNFATALPTDNPEAYIWDIEIPGRPQSTFEAKVPIVNFEWNLRDRNFLVGGLYNGQIAFYDTRKGSSAVEVTPASVSHQGPVHSLLWIHSKTCADFFSTSPDGYVKWWDCRYLKNYLDIIMLDLSRHDSVTNVCSASCLEYDPSIPAKYLVGTENGYVICGNRKGVAKSEKLQWTMKTHLGPIFALERNASLSKVFLTVGDWSARIWSEECKESAIIWTKHYKTSLSGGAWSRSRFSVFFLIREDGYLDVWDLLAEQSRPVLSIKVSTVPLSSLRIEEEGKLAITGDQMGSVYLVRFGDSFSTCQKNEKAIIAAMFDRESRREKTLELRMKELRLTMKLRAQILGELRIAERRRMTIIDDYIAQAEANYFDEVNKMLDLKEETPPPEPVVKKEEDEASVAAEASFTSKFDFKDDDDDESKMTDLDSLDMF